MQIKVITRHTPNNYGSLLQSIATLRVIESLGHQCEMIIGNAMRWDCKEFSHRCKENHYGKTVCLNVWHTWLCGIRVRK